MATTATSPPSQRAKPNLLSSPDASTSAILGASSSGWNHSPRKPISMASPPSSSELNQSPSGINNPNSMSHHQSQSPRKISNSFTQLKRNGLVSNSIFTQSNDNNNNNSPVNSSSPGRVLNRKPQTGLGLGIGVGSTTPNNNHSPISQRQTSSERPSPNNPNHLYHTRQRSDAENHPNVGGGGGGTGMLKYNHTGESNIGNGKVGGVLPRKSKGVDILHKGSYVSNSPFKGGNPTSMNSSNSNSDFGGSSAGGSPIRRSSPNKPSPSTSQDGFLPTTPTKSKSTNSASSSPTKSTNSPTQSLLVSNRLRGPREIPSSPTINDEAENGNGNGVNGNTGVKRERRKTVTFDEVLEVQEFDKESSFDNGSLRSDLSNSGLEIESQLFNGNQNQDEEEEEGEERVWRSDVDGIDVFESSPISKNKLRIKNGSPLISDGDENSPYLNQNQGDQLELTPSISSSSSTTSSSNYSSEPESQLVTPEINAPALAEFDISKELGENSFNDGEKSFNTAANYETDAERSFKSFRNQAEDDGEEGFDNEDSFGQPGLGGIHRVDSMVDELLKEDLLASPSAHKKEMENATNSNRKPLPSLPPPTSTAETQVQKANGQSSKDGSLNKTVSGSELPSLPNWSPLIFDDTPLPEVEDLPPPSNHVRRENSSSSISDEERIERELELEVAAEVPVRRGGSKPSNRIVNSNANANGQTSASVVGGNESPRRNGSVRSRPHISRDKILERVAQEKRNASSKMESSSASPESHGNRGSRPSEPSVTSANDSKATVQTSHTTSDFSARNQVGTSPNKTAARPRNSEPQSIQTNRTESIPKRPGMPSNSASFPKAATLPSPVKETDLERGLGLSGTAAAASSQQSDANAVGGGRRGSNLESPLERLSSEVEAQQMMGMNSAIQDEEAGLLSTKREVKLSNASNLSEVEARKREQGWFDENNTSLVRETSVEPESSLPVPPPKNDYLSAPEASSNSTTSPVLGNGRLSPSLLGAPPKPLTPSQAAEQIIARRRSKKELKGEGRPTRRRSNSTPGRPITSSGLLESSNDFDSTKAENGSSTHHGNGTDSNASSLNSRESIGKDLARSKEELDRNLNKAIEIGFGRGIEREISRIYREGDQKYKVNDRGTFTGVEDKIAHSSQAGDVDSGKAWRKLRRPSDINEYAKEMREYRESENPKKALGKVFVMVDSFTPENLPIPNKTTKFYAVLDNGLHMVKTGTSTLRSGQPSKIGQEFELIQHKNLQFSLTLVVVRDSHLIEPNPNLMTPSSPKKDKHSPSLTSGFSRFFTSPKKQAAKLREREMDNVQNQFSMRSEPILNYINREGAFGRSNVVFDQVASNCLARCLVLELPVSGVSDPSLSLNGPSSNSISSVNRNDFNRHLNKVRGTLRLKLFYLPPMPSVPKKLLPENLADCINGMNAAAATENEPRLEGVLTQLGGDCVSWRRRPVKAQGAHLICFNEITKKPTVKIDLSKAIAVEDNNDPLTPSPITSQVNTPSDTGTSASSSTYRSATIKKGFRLPQEEELDESYNVERSFRITFADGERISFFADTDEEKTRWLDCFKKVLQNEVSNVPVWAGLAYDLLKNRNLEKRQLLNSSSNAQVQSRNPQQQVQQQQSQSLNSTATPLRNSVSKRIQPQLTPVSEIQSTPNQNQRRPVSIAFAPTPTPPSSLASQNPASNKRSSVSTRPIYGQHQSSIPTPTRKPVPGSSSTVGSRPQSMFGATPTRTSKP